MDQQRILEAPISYESVFTSNPRPNLFVNSAELNEAKAKAECYDWASLIYGKIIKRADFWAGKPVQIPSTGGGFFHEGGSDYLITLEHYELTEAARDLALAYFWTGKEGYLAKAREILAGYTEKYLTYEIHDKAHRKGADAVAGGRATPQGINEIRWALPLMWAYDIVYNSLSEAERNKVETDIFRPVAELILPNNEGPHNHQTWYNTAVGAVGVLLKDRRYLEYAIDKPDSGLRFQMANSIRPEGLWYEGSINYHFFALKALYNLAEPLYHNGVNLYNIPGYRKMLYFPLELLNPNLCCTSINDGRQVCMPISTHDGQSFYEIAYRRTGQASYGVMVSKAPRVLLEALIYGVPEVPSGALPGGSRFWPSTGLATLRAGEGRYFKQITFDFLPYAGGHTHQAKLGLEIFGLGRTLAPDPGSIIYRDPVHLNWYKKTVSHNCLLVDGKNQEKTGLQPIVSCGAGPALNFIRVDDNDVYPGIVLSRFTGVTSEWIVDLYQAKSIDENEHVFDWVYHNYGRYATDVPLEAVQNEETGDGYQYIRDLKKGESSDTIHSSWYLHEGLVQVSTLPDGGITQVLAGNGMVADWADLVQIMRTDPNPIPMVIYRRHAKQTVFRTLIQPMPFDGKLWTAEEPEREVPTGVIGMKLRSGKRIAYIFVAESAQPVQVQMADFEAKGRVVMVELEGGKPLALMLDGPGFIKGNSWMIKLEQGQGQLVATTGGYQLKAENEAGLSVNGLGKIN